MVIEISKDIRKELGKMTKLYGSKKAFCEVAKINDRTLKAAIHTGKVKSEMCEKIEKAIPAFKEKYNLAKKGTGTREESQNHF